MEQIQHFLLFVASTWLFNTQSTQAPPPSCALEFMSRYVISSTHPKVKPLYVTLYFSKGECVLCPVKPLIRDKLGKKTGFFCRKYQGITNKLNSTNILIWRHKVRKCVGLFFQDMYKLT